MASNLDLLKKYKSLFSTTLSTGIGTGTTDTITPATVTGLPTTTGITLTFDRVDSGGVATPTKLERITGVISAGNFTSYVRAKDSTTEQAHTGGAVIEMVWNAQDWNDLVDWGLVEHTQLGVHTSALVTTLKASAAEVTTGTNDTKIVTPLAATGIDTRTATFTNKTIASHLAYADTRFKTGTFTRDISITGDQAITGVGFTPKSIIFFAVIAAAKQASWGMSDGTSHEATWYDQRAVETYNVDVGKIITFMTSINASTYVNATISSFGADGFTVNWTKVGSPTGTGTIIYIAFR